jgi:predicted RNase H-like HicB family nuclease
MATSQTVDGQVAPTAQAERRRPGSPISRYVKAAMQHATYHQAAAHEPCFGAIAQLPDVRAQAATPDACRMELRDALETWLLLRVCLGAAILPIDGIPLTAWIQMSRGT